MTRRRLILAMAALGFTAIWLTRAVKWWGNPDVILVLALPPIVGFLVLWLATRQRGPGATPLVELIRRRSSLVDVGLLLSLGLLVIFAPRAAAIYGIFFCTAAAWWAGYCKGRVDAQAVEIGRQDDLMA
jgi:hypothetical protein